MEENHLKIAKHAGKYLLGGRGGKPPSLQSLKTVGVLCAYPVLQGAQLHGRCTAIMPNSPLEYFYFLS